MTTMQKTLIAVTLATAVGTVLYSAREIANAHRQVASMQQQQAPSKEEFQQLVQERDKAAAALAAAQQENELLRRDTADLPRLRGELARLRGDTRELARLKAAAPATANDPATEAALKTWAARATLLKQRLAETPDKAIPELQLITEKDWFDAVKGAKRLETEADFREALRDLRSNAKNEFARLLQPALRGYLQANNGVLPTDLAQLKPYFSTPVDDSILQRYSLLQTGRLSDVPAGQRLVAETAPPVDDEYDTVFRMSINGIDSSTVNRIEDSVKQAGIQFAEAHNGLLPTDAAQLAPYLPQPTDPAKVQELLSQIPPGITTLEQLKAAGILRR